MMPRLFSIPSKFRRYLVASVAMAIGLASAPVFVSAQSTEAPTSIILPADQQALNTLSRVRALVKAGVPNLALSQLQQGQSITFVNETWKAWHQQKWSLFEQLEDYEGLAKDIQALPPAIAKQATHFILPYTALAQIYLGQTTQAGRTLQSVISDPLTSTEERKRARRFMIQLHVKQGDYFNAQVDAGRYHAEFQPQETDWFIERAIIEFLAGRGELAVQILAPINAINAKLLQTFFRYRVGKINRVEVNLSLRTQLQRKRITRGQIKFAHAIGANVAKLGQSSERILLEVAHLEKYYLTDAVDLYPKIISFDDGLLNSTYLKLGETLINEAGLIGSSMGQWYSLAKQLEGSGKLLQAKALYSQVFQDKSNPVLRSAALNHFVEILLQGENLSILKHLFADSDQSIGNLKGLNSASSARILNYALEQSDADLIALIAPHLGNAPPSVKLEDWLLQKARIDIFSGRFSQGKDKLIEWIDAYPVLTGEQVDKILQPVYDLQAANENVLSLELFDFISSKTQSKRHKREILFWKAQSYDSMGARLKAAALYLESALVQNNGFDEWGQSARYHAASTLMEAAYYEDAKRLFGGLLLATKDSARLTTIKQSLQRLWLLKNSVQGG
ncbi:MAG: hypothetical protein ACI9J2_000236 [Saprospiraceae bacterium]|jgi:hypothetical protein